MHKFSKFIHGSATLLPDLVQAVPYWVDDESVRPSMLQSAPAPPSCVPCPSFGAWTVAHMRSTRLYFAHDSLEDLI